MAIIFDNKDKIKKYNDYLNKKDFNGQTTKFMKDGEKQHSM